MHYAIVTAEARSITYSQDTYKCVELLCHKCKFTISKLYCDMRKYTCK